MNKTELIAAVAEKAELSKKDAEKAMKAFTDVVAEELVKGEKIQLVGFELGSSGSCDGHSLASFRISSFSLRSLRYLKGTKANNKGNKREDLLIYL